MFSCFTQTHTHIYIYIYSTAIARHAPNFLKVTPLLLRATLLDGSYIYFWVYVACTSSKVRMLFLQPTKKSYDCSKMSLKQHMTKAHTSSITNMNNMAASDMSRNNVCETSYLSVEDLSTTSLTSTLSATERTS